MKALKIILASIVIAIAIGCTNTSTNCKASYQTQGTSFNQETYVWESFIFNTNSTSRTNK